MGPTLELAKKLNESGIPFQLHVLEGMPHDFMKFPELDVFDSETLDLLANLDRAPAEDDGHETSSATGCRGSPTCGAIQT